MSVFYLKKKKKKTNSSVYRTFVHLILSFFIPIFFSFLSTSLISIKLTVCSLSEPRCTLSLVGRYVPTESLLHFIPFPKFYRLTRTFLPVKLSISLYLHRRIISTVLFLYFLIKLFLVLLYFRQLFYIHIKSTAIKKKKK